jgi:hypothetical protein
MARRPFDIWALACSQSSQKRPGKTNIHTPVENISFVSCEDRAGALSDIQSWQQNWQFVTPISHRAGGWLTKENSSDLRRLLRRREGQRRLKYCTALSCFLAAARVLNVPKFRRFPVFGFFFREYKR